MPTDNRILGLTIRQHVGGRWAVSLLAYVINIPLNLLAILTHITQSPSPSVAVVWIGVAAIGYLGLGLVLLLANVTVLRHRREQPVNPWLVVLIGGVAGAARGLIVGVLAVTLALPDAGSNAIVIRVVTGAGLGAVVVPLAALFLSIVATYISQRRTLVSQRHDWEVTRMKAEGLSDALRTAYIEAIQGDLEQVADTQDPDLARDMSRRIWESGPKPPATARLRIGRVLRTSITTNNYAVWPVALIWVLSAWGPLSLAIGWPRAMLQILFTVGCLWVSFMAGRVVTQRYPRYALLVFVAVLVVVVTASGPIASAIFDERSLQESLNLIVLNSLWLPFVIVLVTVVAGAVRSSEQVIDALGRSVDDEEIRALAAVSEEERVRREVAAQLHGSVQARLLASAALMRQPDLMRQLGITNPAEILLGVDDLVTDAVVETDVNEQLAAIIRPWNALMDIEVHVDPDTIPHSLVSPMCRIMEEGLANAYRHGMASAATVSVSSESTGLCVRVTDDGVGPPGNPSSGMGMALVASFEPVTWSLTRTDNDQTLLEVILCEVAAGDSGSGKIAT